MHHLILCLFLVFPQSSTDYATYLLKDDSVIRAKVLSVTGEEVRLRISIDGGSAEVKKSLPDFSPHSAYRIVAEANPPQSAEGHLQLAAFAARHDLPSVARQELLEARKMAGNQNLAPEVESEIAERARALLLRLFSESLAKGKLDEARRYLSELMIRQGEGLAEAEREKLLDELAQAEERLRVERVRAKEATEAARIDALEQRELDAIRRHLDEGAGANRRALLGSKNFGTAHAGFLAAATHFEAALQRAETLRAKTKPSFPATSTKEGEQTMAVSAGERVAQEARSGLTDSLLNAASLCVIQTQFRDAVAHVNRVLALDPKNQPARDMRARIEIAATQPLFGGRR